MNMSRFLHPSNPRIVKDFSHREPKFTEPYIVGYMSTDVSRQCFLNLSQLRYVNEIPTGAVNLDLNHNIKVAVKRTTENNIEKIDLLLHCLLNLRQYLNFLNKSRCDIPSYVFVTYRRTFIAVMSSAFGKPKPWCILATVHKNEIYLFSKEAEADIIRRKNRSEQEKKYVAWGYKFEQYLTSDSPSTFPVITNPVIENEEFSLFYHCYLENHELLLCAQIDGLLATDGTVLDHPKTDDYATNIQYLKQYAYIELKTSREIETSHHEYIFKRYKLLLCWCQCYLSGLKGVLVGFRNDNGVIQRLQCFTTQEIEYYCRSEWNARTALAYLDYVLEFIKQSFMNLPNVCESTPISLQFDLDEERSIHVSAVDKDIILPSWYTDKC